MNPRHPEVQAALDAHYARPDLIFYTDDKPDVEMSGALICKGKIVSAAGVHVRARRVPNGAVRLVSLTGIGDCFWTRGIIRETLKAGLTVYLDTPFEWAFWDLEGLERFHFWREGCLPPGAYAVRTATYLGDDLTKGQTVYGAMCQRCKVPAGDFKFPIKPEWQVEADKFLRTLKPTKPIMIYRPLMSNPGRRSVSSRNPAHAAYSRIFEAIHGKFHVISVAGGSGESIVHKDKADTTLHNSEVSLTTLMALISKATLVYTNPGMGLVASAAIGTPVIGVFGGYEDAHNYQDTVIYGKSLLLDPINSCRCMSDNHPCDKSMDVAAAIARAQEFIK